MREYFSDKNQDEYYNRDKLIKILKDKKDFIPKNEK